MDSPATSTELDGDEDLLEFLGDSFYKSDFIINSTHTYTAVELQTGEKPVEISVDDLHLRI